MLYYANGGPGPATRLLRVHAARYGAWRAAPAEKWLVRSGWFEYPEAQGDILWLGEYFMVDASEVPEIQQGMRNQAARFVCARTKTTSGSLLRRTSKVMSRRSSSPCKMLSTTPSGAAPASVPRRGSGAAGRPAAKALPIIDP